MFVACPGAPAHAAASHMYRGVGFRELTRDMPLVNGPGMDRRPAAREA
jgi:hypothetical protein